MSDQYGLSQDIINQDFPGSTGTITQGFSPQGQLGYTEHGIDIGYGANAGEPVYLVSSGIFQGSAAGGYVDVFKSDVSGLLEYYQHVISTPGLAVGQEYPVNTPIGTIAAVNQTPSGYSTSGPHLEFGIAASAPAPGAQYIQYADVNPIPVLQGDYSNYGKNVFGSDQGVNLGTNQKISPQQQVKNINQPTYRNPVQGVAAGIGDLLGGSTVGKYITLTLIGVAAIVLVYAAVKGEK